MKNYYLSLLERLPAPEEAKTYFLAVGERIFNDHSAAFAEAVKTYAEEKYEPNKTLALTETLAAESGFSLNAVIFMVIACSAEKMEKEYERRGYDPRMFEDFLKDLACKVGECYRWHGEWGYMKLTYWYPLFFRFELFAIGRFQYQIYKRPDEDRPIHVGGHTVQPEDMVYFIHIPGIGPLTEDVRMDSYRRAHAFFKDDFGNNPCVFYCTSWLLYERNREFMSPDSNIVAFMNDFKIVKSFEVPAQKYWWVFDQPYEGDASVLPRNTSLRRNLADWLANGGKPGGGDGYFLFDGECIINN